MKAAVVSGEHVSEDICGRRFSHRYDSRHAFKITNRRRETPQTGSDSKHQEICQGMWLYILQVNFLYIATSKLFEIFGSWMQSNRALPFTYSCQRRISRTCCQRLAGLPAGSGDFVSLYSVTGADTQRW